MKAAIVGERNGRAVLSDSDVAEMRDLVRGGASFAAAARAYGVSRCHARRLTLGLSRALPTPITSRQLIGDEACTVDLTTRVPATLALEVSRCAGRLGVSRARVLRDALAAYLANEEPVPAAPSASPAPPATEARASARARPRGGMCMPPVVPGGRRT